MKITFLGTGTSHGVPPLDCMIDDHARCRKGVCRLSETDPRHARTRSSLFVEWDGVNILIDASLDFRQQALREKIKRIDAALVTHCHADHIGGLPDLRSYTRQKGAPLPVFGSPESTEAIRRSFGYLFAPDTFVGGGITNITLSDVTGPFGFSGRIVLPVAVEHGPLKGCFGYRLGPLVYIPDMKSINEEELKKCAGAELLVLNCLRDEREHISHCILSQSMAYARRIAPKRCFFIHMCHDIHYKTDKKNLDSWMDFSYDGLTIEI
ncbi:MAG: MBL fold metallo-hydrolase [Chitinispirillaceae bacterium]|nr:MBL fold metallo-hydrolase [Chitinispirillaceae bacterium]